MSTNQSEIQHRIKEQNSLHYHVFRKHWGTNNRHFPKLNGHLQPMAMLSVHLIKKLPPKERQLLSVIFGKQLMTFS